MWRNTVIMAIRDTPATDIVAITDIHMGVITGEGTIVHTIDLITEVIMATRMVVAITGMAEDFGSASASKMKKERRPKRAGVEAPAIMSPLLPNFVRM